MRLTHTSRLAMASAILGGAACIAEAASPTILRYVVAGGGRRSATGTYVVVGTIGQGLAGPTAGAMTGGVFSVRSGFWPGEGPIQCIADYDLNGEVDILDFLDFFDDFGVCNGLPAPCGTFGDPDLNGDTIIDILDFLDFFEAFGAGC